jgi:cytosine/adenosine deaminase-related metal-dependent hydrolase
VIRYHAEWVLPVSAAPIRHATVCVEAGRIAWVGPRASAPPGADEDLGEVILMPGLVNAHCHLELTGMRGFLEDLDFGRWITRLTAAKRAVYTPESLLDAARFGVEEGIRAGITTYADTCDSGVALLAMRDAGVRGIMYQEVFGPDPAQCDESLSGLRAKMARHSEIETELVRAGISPHAPYTVSDELFRAATDYALAEQLPMAIHIAEGELEQELVTRGSGPFARGLERRGIVVRPRGESPVGMLEQLGVLRARPLLIHCVRTDAGDVAAIERARCGVAHCPVSNAKLGHGIAPLAEWLDAHVAVGLGSDSMASNNRMDILEEARLAALLQRARFGSHALIDAATAVQLATIGGARALGLDAEVGTLEVGKAADLAAFHVAARRPVQHPADAVIYAITGAHAEFVCVAGRVLLRGGVLTNPAARLAERVQDGADALARWLADGGESLPIATARDR